MNFAALLKVPRWDLIAWCAWVVAFFVLEGIGLKRAWSAQPLTWLIRDAVPRWLLACACGWLSYHFVVATGAK